MIDGETSALIAVLLDEPEGSGCADAAEANHPMLISAAMYAADLNMAKGRDARTNMEVLIDGRGIEIVALDWAGARHAADAYARWGRGFHPAA